MTGLPRYLEREGLFARLVGAYMRRDFGVIERSVRPDMVLTFPGSSWVAGTYRGYEEFGRYLLVVRDLIRPAGTQMRFTHAAHHMVITHDIVVSGFDRSAEMDMHMGVHFDDEGKVECVVMELSDESLFDELANTVAASVVSLSPFMAPGGRRLRRLGGV
jgi:ketosteroid isomerase-like protein